MFEGKTVQEMVQDKNMVQEMVQESPRLVPYWRPPRLPPSPEIDSGFQLSGFGQAFRVYYSKFRASGVRFRVSGFGFRGSCFGFWISCQDVVFKVSGFGFRVSS